MIKNELFYKKHHLWIFNLNQLKLDIIQQIHDQIVVKHFDYAKTLRLISQCYYWLRINKTIKRYVQNCHSCRHVKTSHDKYNEKFNFLSIFERNWKNIILNFVVEFFRCSNRYNVILIIINRLSKKSHYIFCNIENDDIIAEIIAKMFIQHVWKLHDLVTSTAE